ncbi:hypothetical protein PPERSA_03023 [Pseudocohnilembus persalinus]|uniref:Uncharacterized protein n=1 Tax=Pseudocohnilembus persalinus TaxID=266149 RepID=A0A0V0QF35_PSEPJ|nr:hypothetical protein PPERSA_03023 [Pseudocohnilembus persalinus]|eukprot:KRX00763.1 hypothetical protein PPERSA_03023 [Pseudocohnilembus persalinus]
MPKISSLYNLRNLILKQNQIRNIEVDYENNQQLEILDISNNFVNFDNGRQCPNLNKIDDHIIDSLPQMKLPDIINMKELSEIAYKCNSLPQNTSHLLDQLSIFAQRISENPQFYRNILYSENEEQAQKNQDYIDSFFQDISLLYSSKKQLNNQLISILAKLLSLNHKNFMQQCMELTLFLLRSWIQNQLLHGQNKFVKSINNNMKIHQLLFKMI